MTTRTRPVPIEEILAAEEVEAKPGISVELQVMLAALFYGLFVGALITSLVWWLAT